MKTQKRNIVFHVSTTRTFKSEEPSPGKETWDSEDTNVVLAADAEDAIKRVREYLDRDDKRDGTIKRRIAFTINSVAQHDTILIV